MIRKRATPNVPGATGRLLYDPSDIAERLLRFRKKEETALKLQFVCILVFAAGTLIQAQTSQQAKPRVYVTGTGATVVRTSANARGSSGWASGSARSSISRHDETMELAKDFGKQCTDVVVTLNSSDADYTVSLNHEARGFLYKSNQLMVSSSKGDLLLSNDSRSVSHSVNDACTAILSNWKAVK